MAIEEHFSHDGFDDLSERELAEFGDETIGPLPPGAVGRGHRAALNEYEGLAPFLATVDEHLNRFQYGRHSIEEWQNRYCFPRAKSVRLQLREIGCAAGRIELESNRVINLNATKVASWVQRYLIRAETVGGERSYHIIQGGIGCGKSTLNKYITTVHFEDFKAARVIPSRIECAKLLKALGVLKGRRIVPAADLDLGTMDQQFKSFLKRSMIRDVVQSAHTSIRLGNDGQHRLTSIPGTVGWPDLDSETFREFVERQLRIIGRSSEEAEIIRMTVSNKLSAIGRGSLENRTSLARSLRDLKPFEMDVVIGFYAEQGFRWALLFDGFDYIDAADFLRTTAQAMIIQVLTEWLSAEEHRVHLSCEPGFVAPAISITLRRNTHALIRRAMNVALGDRAPPEWFVLSPSVKDIYARLADSLSTRCGDEVYPVAAANLMNATAEIEKILRERLRLPPTQSLGNLFNGNIRHQINYTRDVIDELAVNAAINSGWRRQITSRQLLNGIEYDIANFAKAKGYRFVDLLLYSSNGRFRNFVTVDRPKAFPARLDGTLEQPELRPEHMGDADLDSGYVGNVLNYHIWYLNPGDEVFLLEKARILEVLRTQGRDLGILSRRSIAERTIREQFRLRGWPTSSAFRLSLYLLVREGMLELCDGMGRESFKLLPLGVIAVKELVSKIGYLENVFFGTNLPRWLVNTASDIERTANVARWTTASLVHTWHLLRLVRHAESVRTPGLPPPERFLFERMRPGVAAEIERMAGSGESRSSVAAADATIARYRAALATSRHSLTS